MGDPSGDVDRERFWRDFLNRGDAKERRVRRVFRALPHAPRCQMCAAPFAGPVAPIMRAFGKRPADKNPRVCHALLDRSYTTASAVVFDHDGAVDKFVGDEVVAMFFPFVSGDLHATKAVQARGGAPASDGTRGSRRAMGSRRRGCAHRSGLGRRGGRRGAHGGHRPRRCREHRGTSCGLSGGRRGPRYGIGGPGRRS